MASTTHLSVGIARVLAVGFVVIFCSSAIAQKGNSNANKKDEQRENQRVAKAEREVKEAREELLAIQKQLKAEAIVLNKNEDLLSQIRKRTREVRETVEEKLGATVGIPEAFKKAKSASEELAAISQRIKKELKEDSVWRQASQAADSAKKAKQILEDDLEIDEAELQKRVKELNHVMSRLQELESKAIANDPMGSKAMESVKSAQKELEECRKKLPKDKIDSDPTVIKLLGDESKQDREISRLESNLAKIRAEFSRSQKKLIQANMELQRARAADAADSNRSKNGKPNKN